MRKPNFYIVGGYKCGTSLMHHFLRQHSEIFMPEVKEIYHFGSDLTFKYPKVTKEEYLEFFAGGKNEKRIGDATAAYLISRNAAKEIKQFNPYAKIIIMLRNPVELIYSLHSEMVYQGYELIKDFSSAINAEDARRQGKDISSYIRCPVENLYYLKVPLFTSQVKKYFDVFGKENVHIIIFDDLKRDTAGEYRKTLQFLGVSEQFQPNFKIVNPNKTVRSEKVRNFLKNAPHKYKQLGKILFPFRMLRGKIFRGLLFMNTRNVNRPSMPEKLEYELKMHFKPEVNQLSTLLKRDLTSWTET